MIQRDYLINTYRHKQYWLPDNKHQVNIWYSTSHVHCSVIDPLSLHTKQEIKFPRSMSQFEDLVLEFQLLADKRYPKQLRHKSNDHVVRQRHGY